jgi:hypothetical protein
MQVKKRNSWEILRDHLADDNSTGLNEYLSALSGEESLRVGELLGVAGIRDIIVASREARLVDILQPAMCGFFLLLGTASLMLPLLTGT